MKKLLLIGLCLFMMTGCVRNQAKDPVKDYLELYRNHSKEVTSSLKELIKDENLLANQQEVYELVMKKQYIDLEYKIQDIVYNGNKATVKTLITVYDFQHSKELAKMEMEKNLEDYINEDESVNVSKYKDLQLEMMRKEKERISYTIYFNVSLSDENWILEKPNYIVLQKLHGIYDY